MLTADFAMKFSSGTAGADKTATERKIFKSTACASAAGRGMMSKKI
jgi:hypothetical protein